MTHLAVLHHTDDAATIAALQSAPWRSAAGLRVSVAPLTQARSVDADCVLVVGDATGTSTDDVGAMLDALARHAPLIVAGTLVTDAVLAERSGVSPTVVTPPHEIRVRPADGVDPRRMEDLLITGRLVITDKVADDVDVLATANVGFTDYPALLFRPTTGIGALLLAMTPASWSDRETLRFVHHVTLAVTGASEPADVAVGMIGYGAIGHEHALAVTAVPGLRLAAVSDPNPARLEVARTVADDVLAFDDSDVLLAEAGVDLVVVSTPPNTHADWARRALSAGTHVVLEKPMALTAADCDEVMVLADASNRLAVVYQNRRFDPDYLVMRRLVAQGAVGELFHVESFVGGYGHPCNYWHSDADVSGGAIFDWGSHYIDQLLDLMPGEVAHVTAANHKRVWHDVTNSDHSRVTIHFDDGRQADFIHSDLAAAPKPKWWALGTHGAIRGDWRSERVVGRSAIGTLDEDVLALADSPAAMSLHAPDGSVTALAVPPAPPFAFHRELADHLLRGLPMSVDAAQSRRVVAVMEAAERSAAAGSAPVRLP